MSEEKGSTAEQVKEEKAKKIDEAKIDAEVTIEEAELDLYMDDEASNGEGPTEQERIEYMKSRLSVIKEEYKGLILNKEEAEGRKDEAVLQKISGAFRKNYKTRKWLVINLRRMGVEIEDRFIPKSSS